MTAMHFGVNTIPSSVGMRPDDLARAAEERGFESLWFADHSYIPRRSQDGHQAHPQGDTQAGFRYCLDTPTAMAIAAMATSTLKLGSATLVLPSRNVMATAKALATVDLMTGGGRLLVGMGTGWHPEELANNGVAFKERYKVLREKVLALKLLWSDEAAEFHGEYVDFDPVYAFPQLAHPRPQIIGCFDGPLGLRQMIEWSDGWLPTSASVRGVNGMSLEEKVRTVHRHLEEAGRDPATYPISLTYKSAFFTGTDEVRIDPSDLERFRGLGISRVMFNLPPSEPDVTRRLLDAYARQLGG